MKTYYLEKSLGIDIREESICLTLLGKSFFQAEVIAAKYIPIKFLDKTNKKNEGYFIEQTNHFLIENNAWTENIVASLPRSRLILKAFELPAPDRKSLDSMMKFELERHFSSGIDSFYYSNHITVKSNTQYHIICAAVKKEIANTS